MNCKNCKWLCDPDMSSVCVNDKSPHCADFVLPNDVCEAFECSDLKTCKNCDCAIKLNMTSNRWTGDIDKNSLACSNENSIKCDDFVLPNDVCEHWQNHDNEIFGDSK